MLRQKIKYLWGEFRALKVSLSMKFIIGVAFVLTITMGISLYYISKKHEELIMEQLHTQAKALFKQIILTRRWIADHGGIFIWAPGKKPNPYLSEPEIIDIKGRKYLKQSPAMVTKELAEYAKREGSFWFHITSLRLVNPENAPDDFERRALIAFEEGRLKELSTVQKINGSYFYRYIAPLYVEEPCLQCHGRQGYHIGDVRGAISIAVPMDRAKSMIKAERRGMVMASFLTISILMLVLYIMMKELVLRPVKHLNLSIEEFSRGKRVQASVIRTGDELEDLSRAFVEMSKALTEYHIGLQEKIRIATRDLEEANKRLAELNQRKSDFIAKISHELRTPLTSIKGAMEYLSARFSKGIKSEKDLEEMSSFLDVIKNNADRLIKMVNTTLDLERIESGLVEMHISRVNISNLIKEVVTGFHGVVEEKGIIFKIIGNADTKVLADEDMIRQVLINLISNAIKVSPQGAEIEISIGHNDTDVIVSIKDQGPGIPPDEREKIFEKFYTRGIKDGTGLGLAICKGIIDAHNGKIEVSENPEGRGSVFTFYLSRVKE